MNDWYARQSLCKHTFILSIICPSQFYHDNESESGVSPMQARLLDTFSAYHLAIHPSSVYHYGNLGNYCDPI
jgi:hypothetical protein